MDLLLRLLGTALVAVVVTATGLGAPARAADTHAASIAHVETTGKKVSILVSVPASATVDLSGVGLAIEGTAVPARASLAATSTTVRRTAVLAIDTSNSMRGLRFEAAKSAASVFLDSVPDDVYVGVVSFAGDVVESLPPTRDRDAARATVNALTLSRQTRLYDGVLAAVRMAGSEGQRTLLVLSDGADTSDTDLGDVTVAVADADVLADVVSLDQGGTPAPLRAIAKAGSGQVVNASSGALRDAFSAEADVLAHQVLVTAKLPDSVTDSEGTVEVSLPTDVGTLTAQAFTTVRPPAKPAKGAPAVAPPASSDQGWAVPDSVMYVGIGAMGAGLVAVLVLLVPRRETAMTAEDRVSTYTARLSRRSPGASSGAHRVDTEQALAQATEAATSVLTRNKSLEERISRRLEGAGSQLKSAEWLLIHVGIFVGAGVVGLLLGTGSIVVGFLFLVLGGLGPWMFLGLKASRRRKAFGTSLPDTLQLMSGSLSAGLSLAQSVDTIVREGAEPIASEFKRVLVETRLGVSLEDSLEGVAERFDSKDFAWVVMAIKIQRQVGGNLAELLDTVAATMREREYMRRQVAALAAEGKLSAYVLGGLPPLFLLYLVISNGDYVHPMFVTPIGWLMLLGAGVLLSVGAFWMSKLIKVEV
ncbi:tight adherence protein B [Nocardioides ginsengisegetis]|uniref:Tight adherence protein B n=1 Tax=Nocardioides ginsengisegetis TaxID=661491 RepID=A0A7W3J0F6_9ACTN|nr:type II secretion system F family protein [Nocardioides ginsengisegetis]MBA8803971.1 tight adherence protein B [Nocardioides ginsengisegetis]